MRRIVVGSLRLFAIFVGIFALISAVVLVFGTLQFYQQNLQYGGAGVVFSAPWDRNQGVIVYVVPISYTIRPEAPTPKPAEPATSAAACVEWSSFDGEPIYTVRQKILSVDGLTEDTIIVTAETCGRVGPSQIYVRTIDFRDALLRYVQKGGEFEVTRFGKNDQVISVWRGP